MQRKLDYSSAVLVERVEESLGLRFLIPGIIAIAFVVAIIPFTHATAATALSADQQTSLSKYLCGSGTFATSPGSGFACTDANNNVTPVSLDKYGQALQDLQISNDATIPTGKASSGCNVWDVPCMGNAVVVFLATIIMGLAAGLLTIAGALFDLLITHTVINFKATLDGMGMLSSNGKIGPIDRMWATFRDVANILIIGMFVFVAISTILSLENYGAKKWIARILIVAVLINFSMFFTKFTIDASNFVARELYSAMLTPVIAQNPAATISTNNINGASANITNTGIEGAFMQDIGISGLWNYGDLTDLTTKSGPLIMLSYALGASVFMIIVATILLYGSFLLASRAILLVFLLLTSSLAFASMLLPGKFGAEAWDKWRTSLINSAIFAPLLMLFLSATLLILTGATSITGSSNLRDFLHNPANTDGWTVLFLFIIASGMLFISIKVANTFASKIAGFDYAAVLPAVAGVTTLAAVGFAGRNTLGRFGENREAAAKKRAEEEYRESKARTGVGTISDSTLNSMKRWNTLSKQSFDARNLKPVQGAIKQSALAKVASAIPFESKDDVKVLTEGGKNGYAQLKEAAKKSGSAQMEEKYKIAQKVEGDAAKETAKTKNNQGLTIAEATHAEVSTRHTAAIAAAETAKETQAAADTGLKTHQTDEKGHADQIDRIKTQLYEAEMKGDQARANQLVIEKAVADRELVAAQERTKAAEATLAAANESVTKTKETQTEIKKELDVAANKLEQATKTAAAEPKINMQEINKMALNNIQQSTKEGRGTDPFSLSGIARRTRQNFYGLSAKDLADNVSRGLKSKEQKEKVRDLLSDEDRKDIAKEAAEATKKADGEKAK